MEKDKVIKTDIPGKCPYCGGYHIEYKSVIFEDDMLVYPGECMECGKKIKEYYTIKYIESIGDDNV